MPKGVYERKAKVNHIGIWRHHGRPNQVCIHIPTGVFSKGRCVINLYGDTLRIRQALPLDERTHIINKSNVTWFTPDDVDKYIGKWNFEIEGDYLTLTTKKDENTSGIS